MQSGAAGAARASGLDLCSAQTDIHLAGKPRHPILGDEIIIVESFSTVTVEIQQAKEIRRIAIDGIY
jgi:hypothetical protein